VHLARLLHLPSRGSGPKGCTCGHGADAHEHYRRGTDCALCSCPKFRAGSPGKSAPRGDGGRRGERAHAA
jgi:hypothetical protein